MQTSSKSVLSKSREQWISDARSLCAFIAVRKAGISNKTLAEFLEREPSSVSNMIRKIEEKIDKDQIFFDYLNQVMREFTLAHQITQDQRFSDCEPILNSIEKAIEEDKLSFAIQNIGLVLSKITTICQETNSLLQKQGLT